MPLITTTTVYTVVLALLTGYLTITRTLTLKRRSQFRQQHNASLPRPLATQNTRLFGLNIPFKLAKWLKTGTMLENIQQFSIENGHTFYMSVLGKSTIFTTSPSNIQALLSTQFSDFELSYSRIEAFKPYTGDGIFSSNGKTWSHARAIARPSLSRAHIANLELYERHFLNLAALIPRDGETVDLQDLFSRLTIDTASEFLFGESVHALDPLHSSTSTPISEAFNCVSQGLAFRLQMGPGVIQDLFTDKKFKEGVHLIHEYVDYFVDKAVAYRTSSEKEIEVTRGKYMYLRELAKDTGDRKVLRDQIVSLLVAGRDTTASLLSLTFWLLLRHPHALQCLRGEIAPLGGLPPSYEQLKGMTYLRWVLDETLRLYPAVPLNERCAVHDAILPTGGGPDGQEKAYVMKGQIIVYNVYAMHRDTDLWGPEANEFRPERWESLKAGWKYVPFGGGPRLCLGQQLALTEAGYTIVRILQTFGKIEMRGDVNFHENLGVTLSVAGGVLATFGDS